MKERIEMMIKRCEEWEVGEGKNGERRGNNDRVKSASRISRVRNEGKAYSMGYTDGKRGDETSRGILARWRMKWKGQW